MMKSVMSTVVTDGRLLLFVRLSQFSYMMSLVGIEPIICVEYCT